MSCYIMFLITNSLGGGHTYTDILTDFLDKSRFMNPGVDWLASDMHLI